MTNPTKWLCAQLRSAKTQISLSIRPVWSESSLCAQWVAKGPKLSSCGQRGLRSDWADAQADLSLRWAHMPFCWFCHETAQCYFPYFLNRLQLKKLDQFVLETKQNPVIIWAPSSEFVSSSIPSWQILTAHAQPFRGARDLAFCVKIPLDSLLVWASSEGSGETARMRRLAWTFAARIGDKYQIRLTQSIYFNLDGKFKRRQSMRESHVIWVFCCHTDSLMIQGLVYHDIKWSFCFPTTKWYEYMPKLAFIFYRGEVVPYTDNNLSNA